MILFLIRLLLASLVSMRQLQPWRAIENNNHDPPGRATPTLAKPHDFGLCMECCNMTKRPLIAVFWVEAITR